LNQTLQSLVGQAFLFFEPSYGDELKAHFGPASPGADPTHRPESSHVIYTRASNWIVGEAHGRGRPEAGVEPSLNEGTPVKEVLALPTPAGYHLEVRLVDGSLFAVVPDPDPDLDPDEPMPMLEDGFADWEVFTPAGCLWSGPGLQWGFVPGRKG
jgi:hypothetical protein